MLRLRYILISLAIINQILCFKKLNERRSLASNKIDELLINRNIKVNLKRNEFSYFYLRTNDMDENANFGSIIFDGITHIEDIVIKGMNINFDYIDESVLERINFTQKSKNYMLNKDYHYNIYELIFQNNLTKVKDNSNNYFIFSIEGKANVEFNLKALAFPKVEIIESDKAKEKNLKYIENQIIYYQIKINATKFRKKTVLIYSENKCHIKFAGNLDSQINQKLEIDKFNLSVFKFEREKTSDIRITFKFKCNEKFHARVLIESTSSNVALFQEQRVSSKIFQTLFSYMDYFDFYYIGNYGEIENTYEIFPIQKVGLFKFYYRTHVSDYILPTEYEEELDPNEFRTLKNKLIIIYIKPILPGQFDIKIFQNLPQISIVKDGITNVKIKKNIETKLEIPKNDSDIIYLTIKKYGKKTVKCNFQGENININKKAIYKELTKGIELTFKSDEDALVELTAIYTQNLYYIVTEKKTEVTDLKNKKGIAIQLEKNTNYYNPEINIKIPPEISNFNFQFYVANNFAKSVNYIPLITKGGNPILMSINDENREEFIQIAHNPYDESKVTPDDDNYFFYVLEFKQVDIEKVNIIINYSNKKTTNTDRIQKNEKYVLGKKLVKVDDSFDQNFIRIVTMKCKNNLDNRIKMKYEEYDMWSEALSTKYSFFQISSIYNGITFELQDKKNPVLFTYSYSNEYIDIMKFELDLYSFLNEKNLTSYTQLADNKLTVKKLKIGNYEEKSSKIYLLDGNDYITNYDNICTLNSEQKSDKFIVIPLDSNPEYDFGKNEINKGNWYLVVVKEFQNPIFFDIIVYSEKVKFENGKIMINNLTTFNETIIGQKIKFGSKKIYLYLNITELKGKEGSILFEGVLPEEYYINTVDIIIKNEDINNNELNERFKNDFQVPNQLIKDPFTNNYELFYEKTNENQKGRSNILLIEIISSSNMEFDITPLPFPKELEIEEIKLEKKQNLSCTDTKGKSNICYYKVKIKPISENYEKKYVLVYEQTKKRLIYKGNLNPIISGQVRYEVHQNKEHLLLVFDFDASFNEEISIIFKFYESIDFNILIEISNIKVVVFNSLTEQIFETIFTYNGYFPFYYIGTFPEMALNWVLYNEQFGNFQLSYNTICSDHILPIPNEYNFLPNTLIKNFESFVVVYVKSEYPGNLKLRFFNTAEDIKMNALNHVYLKDGIKNIKLGNSTKELYLHIKLIGKGKVILNSNTEITNEIFMPYNKNTIELNASNEIIITITVTEGNLYDVLKPSNIIVLKNKKNILFEYPNNFEYSSTEIEIKSNKKVVYYSHFGYAQDSRYFPNVHLGRNPLRNEINELNQYLDSIFLEINPYDQFHIDPYKHKFFYGIEIENENDTTLYISFMKKNKNPMYKYELKEKEFNYISHDHFPALIRTDNENKYAEIMCYFCKRIDSNSLLLKYEQNILDHRRLTDKFNFFKFAVLYNGMHFELQNNSDSAILYYQYTENTNPIDGNFTNEIFKLNNINENYLILNGTELQLKDHPLKNYTIKLKVFLLNREIQEFAYNYDNLCYLTKIEVQKDKMQYRNNVKIIEFEYGKKAIDLKDYKNKWYLTVVGEYTSIIGARLILYKEKVIISEGKIEIEKVNFRELKVGGEKVQLKEKIEYFYIDIKKMGKENFGKEGSIVLKGLQKEEESSKIEVHMAYVNAEEYNEKSFYERIKSFDRKVLNLEYDKKNKIVEFYYEKAFDVANYIIIQIKNYLDKTDLEIQATDFVIYKEINQSDLTSINSLKCNKKEVPCYYQYKINQNSFSKIYFIFYSKSLDRLVYKGSINPSKLYPDKNTIIDENVCSFVVLKYDSKIESDILVTIKFYSNNTELNDVKLKMNYTDLQVVRFIGKERTEKIFQSIFTYQQKFDFYFIQCYSEENEIFEMYNEQPFSSFKIYYKNKFENNLLPTVSDEEIKPNSFHVIKENDIMLIKPLSPSNLNLRIYPKTLLTLSLKKESLYHLHLEKGVKKLINLPEEPNDNESYFISVKSINQGKFKFNNKEDAIDSITEEVKQRNITIEFLNDLLVEIIIRQKEDLYEVISPLSNPEDNEKIFTVRDKKLILIEYENSNNYGKTILELTSNADIKYNRTEGFAKSDKYFPQISESKSNIILDFKESNNDIETVELDVNPYHDLRLKNSRKEGYKYYYGIELEESLIIDVKLKYFKLDFKQSNQEENTFKVMNQMFPKIYPQQSTKNYICIFAHICNYSYRSKLYMNYGDQQIWSEDLENIFNLFKIPLLYKNIYFSQGAVSDDDILFSYGYDDDVNEDTDFKEKIRNFNSGKIEINKKSIKINNPIENYNVSKFYIYLFPEESEQQTNFDNLCYLSSLNKDNDIKKIPGSEKEISLGPEYNGNYYISIIAEYIKPFPVRLLACSGKATFKEGETVTEFIEINKALKIKEAISNYYINLDNLNTEGQSEGSILFTGIEETNIKNYKVKIAYCKKDENKVDKLKSDGKFIDFVYDRLFKIHEIYYLKESKDDELVLIQISRPENESPVEIKTSQLKYYKTSENDIRTKIKNLKCNEGNLCYYKFDFDQTKYDTNYKYFVIFSEKLERLFYQGPSINPTNNFKNSIEEIVENNECKLVSFGFKKDEDGKISIIGKLYGNTEIESNLDITNEKVVYFHGQERKERLFQAFFPYENYFSFYFLECYKDGNSEFEIYPEQNTKDFELFYHTNLNKYIFQKESYQILKPNDFNELNRNHEIIHIIPKGPGNLNLRIYKKDLKVLAKDSFNTIHLKQDQTSVFNIQKSEKNVTFLSINKVNNNDNLELKINIDKKIEINKKLYEEIYTITDETISFKATSDMLITIVLNYENLYHVFNVENEKSKLNSLQKYYLLEYKRSTDYSSSNITISVSKEVSYKMSFGFSNNPGYFPLVSNSPNPVKFRFSKNHLFEYIYTTINPYEQYKKKIINDDKLRFYYALEFDEPVELKVEYHYTDKKTKKLNDLQENKFGIISNNSKIKIDNTYDKSHILFFVHNCSKSNYDLIMKYDNDNLWKTKISNKYNYYNIPILINGIHFDQSNTNANTLFSYKFHNNDINESMEKFKSFKDTNDYILFNESGKVTELSYKKEPISNSKLVRTTIYLLKENEKNKQNSNNLCYLNSDESKNEKEFKKIIFTGKTYKFNDKNELDGNWYMTIESEYLETVASKFIVYNNKVEIKKGLIKQSSRPGTGGSNTKKRTKTIIIIILIVLFVIAIILFIIFLIRKSNDDIENEIPTQTISLITGEKDKYTKFN